MKFLGIDTGTTTGLCTWDSDKPDQIWSCGIPRIEAEDMLEGLISRADEVVCEQLVISMATIKKGRQVQEAIEMVGLVKYWCRVYGIKYTQQKPVEAMRFATDDVLKRIGWYVPGPDHQRDARRHVLTRAAELRIFDLVRLLPEE